MRSTQRRQPANDAQVLVRGGKKYLVGTLMLKSGIDFHLADDAELIASSNRAHYPGWIVGKPELKANRRLTADLISCDFPGFGWRDEFR